MMKFTSLLFFIFNCIWIFSQEKKDTTALDEIQSFVEVDAEFPGGSKEMYKWIGEHFIYPEAAEDVIVEEKVYVSFIVEADGSLSNIKIVKGVNKYIDKECIRLVNSMPKWKPAHVNGKNVRSKYTLPFQFE